MDLIYSVLYIRALNAYILIISIIIIIVIISVYAVVSTVTDISCQFQAFYLKFRVKSWKSLISYPVVMP